jgi:hypothetical protein
MFDIPRTPSLNMTIGELASNAKSGDDFACASENPDLIRTSQNSHGQS